MIRIAIIQFPKSRNEYGLAKALASVTVEGVIFRWKKRAVILEEFDGIIFPDFPTLPLNLPKDFVRVIQKQGKLGKPIWGICQGANFLNEIGLLPKINIFASQSENNWISLKATKKSSATDLFEKGEIIPVPIGKWDVYFSDSKNMVFQEVSSEKNRGICNSKGNVVGLGFYPERANQLRQIPEEAKNSWAKAKIKARKNYDALQNAGSTRKIFESLRYYIEG